MDLEKIPFEIDLSNSIYRSLGNLDYLETLTKDLNKIRKNHIPANKTNKVHVKTYIPKDKILLFERRKYHVTDYNGNTPHGNKEYSLADLEKFK